VLDLALVTGERSIAPHAAALAEWTLGTDVERVSMMRRDPRIAAALTDLIRDPGSYLDVHYHSQAAYRFVGRDGVSRLVRYRLRAGGQASATGLDCVDTDGGRVSPEELRLPLDHVPRRAGDRRAADHLRDEFRYRVRAGLARYVLELQLHPDDGDRSALDPTVPWPPDRYPWLVAAGLDLDHLPAEGFSCDPANVPTDLALIPAVSATDPASVNHVRAVAHRALAAARRRSRADVVRGELVVE
jgi:hypothetical protein